MGISFDRPQPINVVHGQDIIIKCTGKLSRRDTCSAFNEQCPTVKLGWNLPLRLIETESPRVTFEEKPTVRLVTMPDIEIYEKIMRINQAGVDHSGVYFCELKLYDKKYGKMINYIERQISIRVAGTLLY